MRVVGGQLGGRRFQPPASMPHTRPTTDIAKEGLFNILQQYLDYDSIRTLDLFGGTGSISYELASRGVTDLTIVEQDATMYQFIKKTAGEFNIPMRFVKQEVFRYIATCPETFDFIFAGPPYALGTIDDLPRRILQKPLLKPGGVFVLEHTPRNNYETFEGFFRVKNYGTTLFSFFRLPE
jgi:16S rRNA (guanine(966)-N(2))-methyltransferase RsmD